MTYPQAIGIIKARMERDKVSKSELTRRLKASRNSVRDWFSFSHEIGANSFSRLLHALDLDVEIVDKNKTKPGEDRTQ